MKDKLMLVLVVSIVFGITVWMWNSATQPTDSLPVPDRAQLDAQRIKEKLDADRKKQQERIDREMQEDLSDIREADAMAGNHTPEEVAAFKAQRKKEREDERRKADGEVITPATTTSRPATIPAP